jgi:hypothetical protein
LRPADRRGKGERPAVGLQRLTVGPKRELIPEHTISVHVWCS